MDDYDERLVVWYPRVTLTPDCNGLAMWYRLVLAAASCCIAHTAAAQSFDCAKAQTRIEKMVCADRAIADLDEYLGRYYAAARAEIPGATACLQSDQAQWLKSTRDACADGACLKTAYLARLAELDALQPGATALKNVTLPPAPALVWVVPPASDKVAAPPNPKAKPYEAIGTLIDDIASNPNSDGLAIRFQPFFEPSRCVFLHRLPAAQSKPVVQDAEQQMDQVRQKVVSQIAAGTSRSRSTP